MKDEQSIHPSQNPHRDPPRSQASAGNQGQYTQVAEALIVSEVRYRRLFESARDGILILDANTGQIIDVNPFLIELLGMSREQFLGKEVWEIGSFKDVFASKEKFLELQKVGCVRYDNLPLQTVEGHQVPVEFVSNVYLEGQNTVIQCNIRDNAKRNQEREQSRETAHRLSESQKLGHVGSWFMDIGGLLQWSEETYRIYGVSQDTFSPTVESLVSLLHPDDRQAMQSWIAACAAGESPGEQEFRVNRPDGTTRIVLGRGELARDAKNRPIHIAGTMQDITERKQAEAALQASFEELRKPYEAMPQMAWITRPDGWNIYFSRQWMDYTGLTLEESLGHGWNKPFHPDDRQQAWNAWQKATSEHGIYSIESRLRRADGVYRWWLVRGVPHMDAAGNILKWYGTCTDIHDLKMRAAELVIANKELAIQNTEKEKRAAALEIANKELVFQNEEKAKRAAELEIAETKYRTLFENARDGIALADPETGTITDCNPALCRYVGREKLQIVGHKQSMLHPPQELDEGVSASFRRHRGQDSGQSLEDTLLAKNGQMIPVEIRAARICLNGQQLLLGIFRDISERKQAEKERGEMQTQLLQAQKMESVGRLAGGVAHDFNNLLTAINGFAGFVMDGLPKDDPKREDVKEILAAGERATGLTRQLLAFSRKQILNPEVLDVNAAASGTIQMLKRLIGEDIKLETRLAAQPCLVKVDAGQFDQVLLNLAVNARDAMPQGGMLTLETEILSVNEDFVSAHPCLPHGPVVCLLVRDTGSGMTDEIKEHIFEPFYTTKEKGKGTGLGLSTVFGIIKQSGGEIEVESELNRGTTFRIYFPQIDTASKAKAKAKAKDNSVLLLGHETVLFVEDEDIIRRLGQRALIANGYTVLTAANGDEALKTIERHGRSVDLLVTDVVMPGMSGRDLARALAKKNMVRRTLFISGYTDDAIVQHGVLEPGLAFLYKPFSPNALLLKLREVLDGPADQARA
ncbi:MAG TPA: hypothetical protein DCM05_00265 [Elusimicrobia bacterium]|nr:hypothetical protein [Elusimicrobiota bacterium]